MWKITLLALALSGCATAYQPMGITGGFKETRVGENAFLISASGNGHTSKSRIREIVLLRSADLGFQNGYPYFVILNDSTSVNTFNSTMGGPYQTTGRVDSYGNFSATTTGGPELISIEKPERESLVYFFKEKPNSGQMVYEVSFICESLAPKFDTRCGKN